MAEVLLTGAQLITLNDANLADTDVPDFMAGTPFMREMASTPASQNTVHKYLKYALASSGFRDANDGREVQTSTDTAVTVSLQILDATVRTDLALANEYRGGRDAWVNRETGRALRSAFFSAEQQVFQGTGLDAKGFDGFPDDASMDALADTAVVDGGGATNLSSVYLVRGGNEDVETIFGNNGNIEIEEQSIVEVTGATGTYPGIYMPVTGWTALKIGSTNTSATRISVARIANVDVSSGSSFPMTDALFYQAYALFDAGMPPTHCFCHRLALEQWRNDRTTYNPIGTPAPLMNNLEGVQIWSTDGLSVSETALV